MRLSSHSKNIDNLPKLSSFQSKTPRAGPLQKNTKNIYSANLVVQRQQSGGHKDNTFGSPKGQGSPHSYMGAPNFNSIGQGLSQPVNDNSMHLKASKKNEVTEIFKNISKNISNHNNGNIIQAGHVNVLGSGALQCRTGLSCLDGRDSLWANKSQPVLVKKTMDIYNTSTQRGNDIYDSSMHMPTEHSDLSTLNKRLSFKLPPRSNYKTRSKFSLN
jgi:hypothetical protein